jgi:glycerophosphoryl diester phosphodiesterase
MQIIAHRGAALIAPENTIASFRAAKKLGADGIEFDVHMSIDGELVVIHDATLQRTTNGAGQIADNEWRSIQTLDAGGWFDSSFSGERIPCLAEVLALSDLRFEIEIKGFGANFLDRVIEQLRTSEENCDRIEFTSGNLLLLARLKQLLPHVQVGLFAKRPDPWMSEAAFERYILGTAETSGFDVAHVWAGAITPRIVERIHQFGMIAHANDADTPEQIRRAVNARADRCTTSDVQMAIAESANSER